MASTDELERTIRDLERRLAAVEAVQAIQQLKARYAALIDERYTQHGPKPADEVARIATAAAELFTPDGIWDGGERLGRWQGREEIRQRFLEPTLMFTLHYFVNPVIEVDGAAARGSWEILSPITLGNGRAGWMAGIEHDGYRLHEGRWLHSEMKLQVHFLGPDMRGWDQRPRT